MADFEGIIKKHIAEDGTIHADAIGTLVKAISTAVGNEFVEKTRYKAKLEEIDTLKGEKQTAEDNATTAEKWKEKHDKLKKEYDDYKAEQASKEAKTAKEAAVRAYLESKGIKGANLTIAMRGLTSEVEAVELDGEKIKDTKALDDLIAGEFAGLVGKESKEGAKTSTPPTSTGGGTMTKADIYKKDDKGRYVLSAAERQKALIENHIV